MDEMNSCPTNIWTELLAVRDMVVEQYIVLRDTDVKLSAIEGVVDKLSIYCIMKVQSDIYKVNYCCFI